MRPRPAATLPLLLIPALGAQSAAQLPTDIVLVSPLPHPSFPTPDYWSPFELTQDGWVLMVKTSDPVLGRPTELWKPFVGVIPLHSVTPGFELSLVDSAVDDPECRPGLVYVCGMLQATSDPEELRGFVYEVDTDSGQIRSLIEGGIRILRYQPSDGSHFRIDGSNPSGMPPWDNKLIGVPPAPLPPEWYPLAGIGSRFGWGCLARNYTSGERTVWTYSNAAESWTEVAVPNGDEVVDLSDDGLLVVRELLAPGLVRYHSVAADGSIRSYPIQSDPFEAANSHGLVLQRQQVFEHSTGAATAFPGPLNLLDINDHGAVVGTDGYWQLNPVTPLHPADCSPPILFCPSSVVVTDPRTGTPGETVFFEVWATDDQDPSPLVTCTPPSGSHFPRGSTLVTCTATDASGNRSVCTFWVTVLPTIRPRRF